ncbi:MAG: GHMP family kinase ATP-binding protein [Promethearchaeota archaeon]
MDVSKKKILVEVPHRISGFFEIVDEINGIKIKELENIGSRGAGFCLSAVGKTEIDVEFFKNKEDFEIEIYINGERLDQKAETTYYIIEYVKTYIKNPIRIKISHQFDLPVGCGFGASGSGALGTIFGLNYLLNLNLSYFERGRIAHIAEVINKTGLGTVCGQLGRGLCMLKEPGYPCVSERITIPTGIKIICGTFGMIHTKSILKSESLSTNIKVAGKKALQKLMADKSINTFTKASIDFVKETNILSILNLMNTKNLMEDLNKLDIIGASMNQLGRSVYAIGFEENVKEMIEVFETFKPKIKIFTLSIDNSYPRILKVK